MDFKRMRELGNILEIACCCLDNPESNHNKLIQNNV